MRKARIWVAHGNKVLRCAPQQLREVTPEQEAALRYVPVEVLAKKGKYVLLGAQTFTDISGKGLPEDRDREQPIGEPLPKRQRRQEEPQSSSDAEDITDLQQEEEEVTPPVLMENEGEVNEESTAADLDTGSIPSADGTGAETQPAGAQAVNASSLTTSTATSGREYGPLRERRNVQHETTALDPQNCWTWEIGDRMLELVISMKCT